MRNDRIRFDSERRRILAAGLVALLPRPVMSGFESNPDVVIVGAGAAGLAAARYLAERGLKTVLVEGSGRIGGRAYTDIATFGVPYDVGAHWVHYDTDNPYYNYAIDNGFDLYRVPEEYRVFAGRQQVKPAVLEELWSTYDSVRYALAEAGDAGLDISAAQAVKNVNGPWKNTAELMIGPWEMGKDFDEFSSLDWWNSAGGKDYFCSTGYGTLVAHYGAGIPVSLNTAVTGINWNDQDVAVETTSGTIRPKAVILTVSTGVLSSGAIRFTPKLPLVKRESFESISMGLYNHIALLFSEDVFDLGKDGYLIFQIGNDGRGFGTLTNSSGSGLAYCDVGGRWAQELERESIDSRIDYALGEIRALLGSSVDRAFVKGAATTWGKNRWTLGSYASAAPGSYPARNILRQPVAEKIFFAGEACHELQWATVGGAFLSGVDTAETVARKLGA